MRSEQGLALSDQPPIIAPNDLFFGAEHFRHLRFGRQYERALEELARVRKLDPAFNDPIIALAYFGLGRLKDAQRARIAYYESCGERCDPLRESALRGWAEGGWAEATRAVARLYAAIEGFSPNTIAPAD